MNLAILLLALVLPSSASAQIFMSGFWNKGSGFFVRTAGTYDGNRGGLSGANTTCLNELKNSNWRGKSNAVLTAAHVRAFLCDGSSCQNLSPNVRYSFAVAGNSALGGATLTTNASALGPGDIAAWNDSSHFGPMGGTTYIWTGQSAPPTCPTTPSNYWPGSVSSGTCSGWTLNTALGTNATKGAAGNIASGQTDCYRWGAGLAGCNTQNYLICVVNP